MTPFAAFTSSCTTQITRSTSSGGRLGVTVVVVFGGATIDGSAAKLP